MADTNPTFPIPFGFAGGLHDKDTGFLKFGYRDYDPESGRWTAKDPIGFAGGNINLYEYVGNSPSNYTDPSGLLVGDWHFGITYVAARYTGEGVLDSLKLAWQVMREDRNTLDRSADAANIHGMRGEMEIGPGEFRYQTPDEALAGTMDIIQNGPLSSALHAGQDLPGHNLESMQNFGFNWSTPGHLFRDLFPKFDTISEAYQNTKYILNKRKPCK